MLRASHLVVEKSGILWREGENSESVTYNSMRQTQDSKLEPCWAEAEHLHLGQGDSPQLPL